MIWLVPSMHGLRLYLLPKCEPGLIILVTGRCHNFDALNEKNLQFLGPVSMEGF